MTPIQLSFARSSWHHATLQVHRCAHSGLRRTDSVSVLAACPAPVRQRHSFRDSNYTTNSRRMVKMSPQIPYLNKEIKTSATGFNQTDLGQLLPLSKPILVPLSLRLPTPLFPTSNNPLRLPLSLPHRLFGLESYPLLSPLWSIRRRTRYPLRWAA